MLCMTQSVEETLRKSVLFEKPSMSFLTEPKGIVEPTALFKLWLSFSREFSIHDGGA